ncbi:MAG: calcium/sodium antiporter [Dehalococcoidia bacterium]|nr:calcium/sodium antiporter [Dehalococcoidia bacterium]
MALDAVLTVAGLGLLLAGAWLLVRSASRLAMAFGLSPVIVGATVVAFGTSAPEFVVGLAAGVGGAGALAVGSVFGSNITNVALVLGIAAVIRPMDVHPRLLRWEMPVLLAATAAVAGLGLTGTIGHATGALLFLALVLFIGLSLWRQPDAAETLAADHVPAPAGKLDRRGLAGQSALLALGVGGLAIGSELVVNGATGIAGRAGISEVAIGVTVVAIGTSMPEIVTTAVAALRGNHDIALGNVVGSNVFNLLGVLGLTGAVATLPIDSSLYLFEVPALAVSTIVLFALSWSDTRITRWEGAVLLAAYVAMVATVLVRGAA